MNLVSLRVPSTLTSLLDPSAEDASTTMLHWRDVIGPILSAAHIPNKLRIKSLWSARGRCVEATVRLGTLSVVSAAFLSSTGGLSICTGGTAVLVAVPLWICLRCLTQIYENATVCADELSVILMTSGPAHRVLRLKRIELSKQSGKGQINLFSFCLFFV